jgi:hypothetical protein
MTRTPTTVPTTAAPTLTARRFRLLVAATIGLAGWTVVQQRSVNDAISAAPAPIRQSVRQVEHADEARAALRRLDETDVTRFTNRVDALAAGAASQQEQEAPRRTHRPGVQP